MSASFLDTTIVVSAASPNVDLKVRRKMADAIRLNQPCYMAAYAIRELLAGAVRVLCDTHNTILASETAAEALLALLRRSPMEGRTREARVAALADQLGRAFQSNPVGSRDLIKQEILDDMALRVVRFWREAQRIPFVEPVQPLSCFSGGSISFGSSGELRGPNDSFGCDPNARCSAAAYIYSDRGALKKMIDAMKPDSLPEAAAAKRENSARRKALKELEAGGPVKFNKQRCRALGDAYFAAQCPPGTTVLTTNISDFQPLCSALGKKVSEP